VTASEGADRLDGDEEEEKHVRGRLGSGEKGFPLFHLTLADISLHIFSTDLVTYLKCFLNCTYLKCFLLYILKMFFTVHA
jgi:hypothetical protein